LSYDDVVVAALMRRVGLAPQPRGGAVDNLRYARAIATSSSQEVLR
jgi:hypothetical protein